MRRQIFIAEIEPRLVTQSAHLLQYGERITGDAPTFAWIAQAGKCVSNRVDVRRNVKSVHDRVVAGVTDHRQFGGIDFGGQSFNQLRPAGAAAKCDDHEVNSAVNEVLAWSGEEKLPSGPLCLTSPSVSQSDSTSGNNAGARNLSP